MSRIRWLRRSPQENGGRPKTRVNRSRPLVPKPPAEEQSAEQGQAERGRLGNREAGKLYRVDRNHTGERTRRWKGSEPKLCDLPGELGNVSAIKDVIGAATDRKERYSLATEGKRNRPIAFHLYGLGRHGPQSRMGKRVRNWRI